MKKRVAVVALAVLLTAWSNAQTPNLIAAVQSGTPLDVQAAIDEGADVNAVDGGLTPLEWAAYFNKNPEVITTLLKAGANIEARDVRSGIGGTALGWAAYANKSPEVIAALLKAGADVEARTEDDRNALSWAAQYNTPEVVLLLLNAGTDAKRKDKFGFSALHYAKYNGSLKGTDALRQLEEASQ